MTSAESYDVLIGKIDTFIRKYHYNNLLRGLLFLAAGVFSAYVVIALCEYFGNFNTVFRSILYYFFILLNVVLIVWLIVPSLLARLKLGKTLTHDQAANIIGHHFGDVHDKLLNTLQLKKQALENPQHRELLEASISQKIEMLKPISFPSAIDFSENKKYLKWVIPPAAVICIIAFAAPSILTESTKRIIRHNEYFAPVAPFQFEILNNNLSVMQGADLNLKLRLTGDKIPVDVYIETANTTFKLDKETLTRFRYQFNNLQQSIKFRFVAGEFTSALYEIKVALKPLILHFDADLYYPAYLHKKNEAIVNAGDLTLPAGTTVKWHFNARNASALDFILDGKKLSIISGNDGFNHEERIIKSGNYTVSPMNRNNVHGDSASYRLNVIADEAPVIQVGEKADSVSSKAFYFNGSIHDDHGFSSLAFRYKITRKGIDKIYSRQVKASLSATESPFFYLWDHKQLGIQPGDQVTYYFEVADNDAVNGPKTARTPERTLSVPDASAQDEQLNAGTQAVKQKMQSAVKLAGQIERNAQKLNQNLLDKNNLSFDEKKQVEELLQRRKELEDLVKDIQAENKKNLYNRQENQEQTQELIEKQKQIEDLFNNVLDEKTREMLKSLQQLLEQNQKDATRDELSKMQMDNKSLKKELDRILDLYKKLDFDQKLNQAVNQLNQLARQQQKLADDTKQNGSNTQQLQQQQQKLNSNFQDVKKSLTDLQKMAEQSDAKTGFKNPEQEQQAIEDQMKQGADELKKNNKQQASKSQQNAAKQMQQLADKMQQDEQEGESSENNIDARQLRELLKSLVNSSFNQEKVMQGLRGINPMDPAYTSLAQKQKDIKDNLKTAEDSLYSLSKRVPQIQSTVNKEISAINDQVNKALENLGERKTGEATRNQQFAMTAMNNLALMLSEALDQLQKQQNKSGKGKGKQNQPSMSQLSKMQQQLNNNMQKAREQMQQQGNKPQAQSGQQGMSEQLARMARQQQLIRQSLQQLNREQNKDGTGGLGNLDKISKEMEQTENDLVNRKITEEAIKRQQQIQTRLLEAEKAEQQREQEQKRESHAGNQMPPGYIKALQEFEQVKTKQTEQIRTVPPSLNLFYKQKVKNYFDQLNAK